MNPKTFYRVLKTISALFALNGVLGLLVVLLVVILYLVEKYTGMALLPHKTHQHATISGLMVVIGMASFWAIEVLAAWLVWVRLSKRAIYLTIGISGIWVVCLTGIALEVLETGTPEAQAIVMLSTAAIICWPCILAARHLSSGLLRSSGQCRIAELGSAPNGGSATQLGDSGVRKEPPSVS